MLGLLGSFCLFLSENVRQKFVRMKNCHRTHGSNSSHSIVHYPHFYITVSVLIFFEIYGRLQSITEIINSHEFQS